MFIFNSRPYAESTHRGSHTRDLRSSTHEPEEHPCTPTFMHMC